MKLVTISTDRGGEAGAVVGEHIIPVSALMDEPMASVGDVVRAGPDYVSRLADAVDAAAKGGGAGLAYNSTPLLAPFARPGMVFSTGGNYRSHIAEVEAKIGITIGEPKVPVGFIKNSNAIVGHRADIVLPAHSPDQIDWEAEFCFVIGRACHAISEDDVEDVIAGYTMINDVSNRAYNKEAERPDGSIDFTLPTFGKQFPTFCPMGPCFVTKDEIPDAADVNFSLRVNGETMQDGNTGDVIFNPAQILAYFSTWHPFEPGDVVSTGSPAGVGFARSPKIFLKPGDEISITADAIGTMVNSVVMGS